MESSISGHHQWKSKCLVVGSVELETFVFQPQIKNNNNFHLYLNYVKLADYVIETQGEPPSGHGMLQRHDVLTRLFQV